MAESPYHASRKFLMLIALSFAVIYLFGWAKSVENQHDSALDSAWHLEERALTQDAVTQLRQKGKAWTDIFFGNPDARKNVERLLVNVEEVPSDRGSTVKGLFQCHPKYGFMVELQFSPDGECISYNRHGPISLNPQPSFSYRNGLLESVRGAVAVPAFLWWWTAFLLGLGSPRYGVTLSWIAVLLAVALGCIQLVSPLYSVNFNGIFSNDSLFFASLMLLASLCLLAFRAPPQFPLPHQFGLRTLLGVMTIVAISGAAGPFGWVALIAFATSLAIYLGLAWMFHARRRNPSLVSSVN